MSKRRFYGISTVLFLAACSLLTPGCASQTDAPCALQRQEDGAIPLVPETSVPDKTWPEGTSFDPDKKDILVISSIPEGAQVFLNEAYMGTTPVELGKYPEGFYRIRIVKSGYMEYTSSFHLDEKQNRHHAILSRITGTLSLSVSPEKTLAYAGADNILPGTTILPVGNYSLHAWLFGYEAQTIQIVIRENQTTEISISLVPAVFSISGISISPQKTNPRLAGVRGRIVTRFEVSGPGKGRFRVRDKGGNIVFEKELEPFRARYQTVTWNGRDSTQNPVPDGIYSVEISAQGTDNAVKSIVSEEFRVDQTGYSTARQLSSGQAGLLLLPDTITLSNMRMQADALCMLVNNSSGNLVASLDFSLGIGILDFGEAVISGSTLMSPSDPVPVSFSGSYKHSLIKPFYPGGFGLAGIARITWKNTGDTGITADPAGFTASLPAELRVGDFGIGISPELLLSWQRSSGESAFTYPVGFYFSSGARMGIFYDNNAFSAGVSCAILFVPFDSGFGIQFPVYTAAEARFLVPDSSLYISGNVVFLFQENGNIDWSAGAGISLLW